VVQVEKLMGQVRQRDEVERVKVLEQAREELLAGRAELRREQAARKKRADRRRRKRGSKAKAQQQPQQHQQPEAQEGEEGEEKDETGPPPGEGGAAGAEEAGAAAAPLPLEGGAEEAWSDCSICLEALDEREAEAEGAEALRVEALASCPHSFHSGCLDLWVGRCAAKAPVGADTCPDCRAEINR
jgi:hypothetical protein